MQLARQDLEREAARHLAEARKELATPREPGRRERYRRLLELAIEHAEGAIAAATEEPTRAGSTLAQAHAAKAEDALHGAGQLSLSAQRAPTREACDDGWRRVEAIALGAEASARAAATIATELASETPRSALALAASTAAERAGSAARAARKLILERNDAYTFHTDGAFSFGEGWYLAAAAVLAGVAIQLEPGKEGTAAAETFLRDAGVGSRLQAYRPRPRAMKHTTELVARAFRAEPAAAQQQLRAAFLGDAPVPSSVREWVDRRLPSDPLRSSAEKKVLLWIRDGAHHPARNTSTDELCELTERVRQAGLVPVLTGDALPEGRAPDGAGDLILFWKDPVFRQADLRRAQLQFFEHLKERHGLIGQLGVTTAGMDGPALMGLPTMYLTDEPNVRMREWVGAVPGYQELVRTRDYLEHVTRVLSAWANAEGG